MVAGGGGGGRVSGRETLDVFVGDSEGRVCGWGLGKEGVDRWWRVRDGRVGVGEVGVQVLQSAKLSSAGQNR